MELISEGAVSATGGRGVRLVRPAGPAASQGNASQGNASQGSASQGSAGA